MQFLLPPLSLYPCLLPLQRTGRVHRRQGKSPPTCCHTHRTIEHPYWCTAEWTVQNSSAAIRIPHVCSWLPEDGVHTNVFTVCMHKYCDVCLVSFRWMVIACSLWHKINRYSLFLHGVVGLMRVCLHLPNVSTSPFISAATLPPLWGALSPLLHQQRSHLLNYRVYPIWLD